MHSPEKRPFGDDLQHLLQGRFEDFTGGDVGLGIKVPFGVGERLDLLLGGFFGDDIEDLSYHPFGVEHVRAAKAVSKSRNGWESGTRGDLYLRWRFLPWRRSGLP
jgi:hypothetical protein